MSSEPSSKGKGDASASNPPPVGQLPSTLPTGIQADKPLPPEVAEAIERMAQRMTTQPTLAQWRRALRAMRDQCNES
jgi:hypothetical protein